ncbi:MAG: hypothetical protein IJU76_15325 [Desulfovibrionaceae bacterium]|nr:hypothetical protein [Desulfovibrionaceae bacterium]
MEAKNLIQFTSSETQIFLIKLRKVDARHYPEDHSSFLKFLRQKECPSQVEPPPTIPPAESPAKPYPKPSSLPILDVDNPNKWDAWMQKLAAISGIQSVLSKYPNGLDSYTKILNKFENELQKLAEKVPDDFDEETNEKTARKIIKVIERIMPILEVREKSPSETLTQLKQSIETYLKSVGITSLQFKSGDSSAQWADLDMDKSMVRQSTNDPALKGKIYRVYCQPRQIRFKNAYNEIESYYFGGKCAVYSLVNNS